MRNWGQNFLSRQVMMMCYWIQEKAEVEKRGGEGDTQGWIVDKEALGAVAKCNFPTGDFNIERIKWTSSAIAEPQTVLSTVLVKWMKGIRHWAIFLSQNSVKIGLNQNAIPIFKSYDKYCTN